MPGSVAEFATRSAEARSTRARGPLGPFAARHIGAQPGERDRMLSYLGFSDLDALVEAAMPRSIRMTDRLELPAPLTEAEAARVLAELAARNRPATAMIGLG